MPQNSGQDYLAPRVTLALIYGYERIFVCVNKRKYHLFII